MSRKKRKNKKMLKTVITIILALIAAFSAYEVKEYETIPDVIEDSNELTVHFIDVGQGCSTLIQSGDYGVLIDAGEAEYGTVVCNYLNECKIKCLPYIIVTHPHSDHVGGMTQVINGFKCGKVFEPELLDETVPASSSYEKYLDSIEKNGLDAEYAQAGMSFSFGGALFEFFGPVSKIDDLNNMSVVVKITYKGKSVLIPGDAEKKEMSTLVDLPYNFRSDVYLMSHHGSSTGLHNEFLKRVSPKTVIISCGKNNDYGHPHREALSYIKNNKLKSYRTDTQGDIVLTINDSGCTFKTEK